MNQVRSPASGDDFPEAAVTALANQTDEELAQVASDDHNVFAMLYRRHVTAIYRNKLAKVGAVHDAEDLTTQTFEAALHHIASYQGIGKISVVVARNCTT